MSYNDELRHHGIKGMKWGVRRYQNYDGTYTQEGLKRYNSSMKEYEKSRANEKQTRADYKAGKASKLQVARAKAKRQDAKRWLNKDYKQLKLDKAADQGRELYASGKTIRDNNNAAKRAAATAVGAVVAGNIIASSTGAIELGAAIATIGVGRAAVKAAMAKVQNEKIRAYYAHSRPKR